MGVTPLTAGIRPPLVDGLFYPSRQAALVARIQELLARSETPKAARFAVIAPHAGYEFCGEVMASAYLSVALRRPRRVVLIGPLHRDPDAYAYLPESSAFAIPLGEVPVDTEAVRSLRAADTLFQSSDIPHLEEHCLELQLPFLFHLFPDISIVPILVSTTRASIVTNLAHALEATFPAAETLYVATSNMTSYMTGHDLEKERVTVESLLIERDWRGLLTAAEMKQISACGVAGMATILLLAGKNQRTRSWEIELPGTRRRCRECRTLRGGEYRNGRRLHTMRIATDDLQSRRKRKDPPPSHRA